MRDRSMPATYDLELFVVGHSTKAQRAEQNVRRVCDERLAGRYRLQITDVLEDAAAAEAANIVATPALVRRTPLPVRVVVGDLSRRRELLFGLGLEADADDDDDEREGTS
jgi:circadian clock protein KaiB